jgi:hypothetical protein
MSLVTVERLRQLQAGRLVPVPVRAESRPVRAAWIAFESGGSG